MADRKAASASPAASQSGAADLFQPRPAQAPDAAPDDAVRHQALFDPVDGPGGGVHGAPAAP
jgi:hypothetical protein